ncbi:MAG: acetyl-CoA synthase subunit gamma [Deltaproteobacteria bacterium]|nr:acetyl-CoA synthase subunit gamma [Deltaproteobacteria bacterium]
MKNVSCCGPQTKDTSDNLPCCTKQEAPEIGFIPSIVSRVSAEWTWMDYLGQIRCRVSSFRNSYTVKPGLYAAGNPDKNSDVFVSANYKMSFDILRRALKDINAWILVLDTKGINVWCAAGKGTFGTDELIKRIDASQLEKTVSHKRIIAPQLGAPGIAAHIVQQKTGFRISYGPIDARDIRRYVEAGYKATEDMRRVKFTVWDRLVLTPMELLPALKGYVLYALLIFFIISLKPSGIIFKDGLANGLPFFFLGFLAVLSGALVTPLLLPFVPFRSFAVKGWIIGLFFTFLGIKNITIATPTTAFYVFSWLFFPLASSYIALQFTGSTVFTGMSGVKKELRFAMPVYISTAIISFGLLVLFKLNQWGLL